MGDKRVHFILFHIHGSPIFRNMACSSNVRGMNWNEVHGTIGAEPFEVMVSSGGTFFIAWMELEVDGV